MTLQNLDLILISLMLLTGLVLLQSLSFAVTLFQLSRQLSLLERTVTPLIRATSERLTFTCELLVFAKAAIEKLPTAQAEVVSALRVAHEMASQSSKTLADGLVLSRSVLQIATGRTSGTLTELSQKALSVQRAVLRPLGEISAILRAGRVTLTHLFFDKKPRHSS